MNIIGIRKEEKAFEGRVPIVPKHAEILSKNNGIRFLLEPSNQRAFNSTEYEHAEVEVQPLKGSKSTVILGIKEMPLDFFEPKKVYVFFSHTIKGQPYNMPMLRKIIDIGATLIDYEKIVDETGMRLIFFGNWAGMAGISETLRILGERLQIDEITPNPFLGIKPALECKDLPELEKEFHTLSSRIKNQGLPDDLNPFVIGFAGYGNVSQGAQKLFDILPHKNIEPSELPDITLNPHLLNKCVFKEEHMVEPKDTSMEFELQDYYKFGSEKYTGAFSNYIPYLTVLMNCIFWSNKYPRLVTKEFIHKHWKDASRKLRVIGDISCDIEGAIEITMKCTHPDDPAFTYLIAENQPVDGIQGDGPVIMAVDNLPAELPRESSTSFSETLLRFIPPLANADFSVPFIELNLPRELKDAVIVYHGELTENYKYLNQYITD